MTINRPRGGFAVAEIAHLGVGARCCYNTVEFEVREELSNDRYLLFVFGKLDGDDEHMYNGTEVSMTKKQLLDLADYIKKKAEARK